MQDLAETGARAASPPIRPGIVGKVLYLSLHHRHPGPEVQDCGVGLHGSGQVGVSLCLESVDGPGVCLLARVQAGQGRGTVAGNGVEASL